MRSCRSRASARTAGETPCAENTSRAPSGTSAVSVDEDRAAVLERLHDVPVVHDLLAHVDGRAVLLEGLLDGLDGAVDAGAVAAGRGEQDALAGRVAGAGRDLRSGHGSRVRAPARRPRPRRARTRAAAPPRRGDDRGMTPPLPLPVRVAAGLVATAVEQARDLPRLALELPVTAVSQALQASMRVQQKVTELAIKGDQVLGVGPPIEDEPAWATFDEDPAAAAQRPEHGPAAPAATVHPAALRTRPVRRARPGRPRLGRSRAGRPDRRPSARARPGADAPTRPGRPARLRLAHHPPAARQAAPPRRRTTCARCWPGSRRTATGRRT